MNYLMLLPEELEFYIWNIYFKKYVLEELMCQNQCIGQISAYPIVSKPTQCDKIAMKNSKYCAFCLCGSHYFNFMKKSDSI